MQKRLIPQRSADSLGGHGPDVEFANVATLQLSACSNHVPHQHTQNDRFNGSSQISRHAEGVKEADIDGVERSDVTEEGEEEEAEEVGLERADEGELLRECWRKGGILRRRLKG